MHDDIIVQTHSQSYGRQKLSRYELGTQSRKKPLVFPREIIVKIPGDDEPKDGISYEFHSFIRRFTFHNSVVRKSSFVITKIDYRHPYQIFNVFLCKHNARLCTRRSLWEIVIGVRNLNLIFESFRNHHSSNSCSALHTLRNIFHLKLLRCVDTVAGRSRRPRSSLQFFDSLFELLVFLGKKNNFVLECFDL
ncbi:hypothetical protein PBCV1_a463L [Paramecium bursaria Chlorella virus 1]|uniref:Uncharacterized protein n=1 Tax=Paramecium bursaria Chlorella virus 1 TaxID=10506 RepID=Q98513_PBCV1|nr:hypothetical protein PBCV1_a463L [Paramecium bursaria Chlorella virus 1]AAC96830.2 hypothetical protein [Paramecium bursaria Chlorella virus 1]